MYKASEPAQSANQDSQVNVWVSTLSWTVAASLLSLFFRRGQYNLRYTATTRGGTTLSRCLRFFRITKSAAVFVKPSSRPLRVDDPASPRVRIQSSIPNSFTEDLFGRQVGALNPEIYPDLRIRTDRIHNNLRKAAAWTTIQLLIQLESARDWHQANNVPEQQLVIVSPDAALANSVPKGWTGSNAEFVCPWSPHNSLVIQMVRGLIDTITTMFRPRSQCKRTDPMIAVPATHNLGSGARGEDLFWWRDADIPPDRVLLYQDREDWTISKEILSSATNLGIKCVSFSRNQSNIYGTNSSIRWIRSPGPVMSIARVVRLVRLILSGFGRGPVRNWAACRLIAMSVHANVLEDFIREFNIKALFHYQDAGIDYPSVACDAAEAARIGIHGTHFVWPVVSHARIHQVYFAWGAHYENLIKEAGNSVDHLLKAGCTVPGSAPGTRAPLDVLKEKNSISETGATRFLAFFDTSLPTDQFYGFFLKKVIEDSRWGLLIKPKTTNFDWVINHLPDLETLYQEALDTGRVKMLDSDLATSEAAAATPLSISVDINSASVVAALAGHRAIHLDYLHLHKGPHSRWADFHRSGPNQTVFDDPEKLWIALNGFYDNPEKYSMLGITDEHLLSEIDPFRDGKAGKRIGDFLRWYLQALDNGDSRDRALDAASKKYLHSWPLGGPKITAIGPRVAARPKVEHKNQAQHQIYQLTCETSRAGIKSNWNQ